MTSQSLLLPVISLIFCHLPRAQAVAERVCQVQWPACHDNYLYSCAVYYTENFYPSKFPLENWTISQTINFLERSAVIELARGPCNQQLNCSRSLRCFYLRIFQRFTRRYPESFSDISFRIVLYAMGAFKLGEQRDRNYSVSLVGTKAPLSITQGNVAWSCDSIPSEKGSQDRWEHSVQAATGNSRGHLGPGPNIHWLCVCCSGAPSVSPSLPRANSWPLADLPDTWRFGRAAPFLWVTKYSHYHWSAERYFSAQ